MLKDIFIEAPVPRAFYNRAFPLLIDSLLLCLSDPTEAARHTAACLLCKFLNEITDVDSHLRNVLRALVPRFGSEDIDGVAHLPPIMRPAPEYKPLQLTPVEKSEDVRQELLQVLLAVLDRSSDESAWNYLDMVTGLLRAGAMDLCPTIKLVALQAIAEFCDRHQHMLLHFTEPLSRSILSCLVHQHAKIRMGALRTLTHVLRCGLYKYTCEIVQMLSGWRDPNFVPIKALYEVTTIRNYFAELLSDHSPVVRMFFFEILTWWLLEFDDKADYESWLFPYLLSGLFDPFRPIQQLVFVLLERLGRHYEATHEKELREIKQLGAPEPWSYEGKVLLAFPLGGYLDTAEARDKMEETNQFISFVGSYSQRLRKLGFEGYSLSSSAIEKFLAAGEALIGNPPRPCLGSRMMVRTYFRRYAKALFERVEDFKEVTHAISARLLVVSLAYIEEAAVEWLDDCLRICSHVLSAQHRHSKEAVKTYSMAVRLLGVFIDPENYWDIVKVALEEHSLDDPGQQIGMIGLLDLLLEGTFMALQNAYDSTLGLGRLGPIVPKITDTLARTYLLQEQFANFAAESVRKVVKTLLSGIVRQKEAIPEATWQNIFSTVCSVTALTNGLDDEERAIIPADLQELLEKVAKYNLTTSSIVPGTPNERIIWIYADVSTRLPPTNLASLIAYIKCLPDERILEEESFYILREKLQQLSAATHSKATRCLAIRTALRLARRLVLMAPSSGNILHNRDQSVEVQSSLRTSSIVCEQQESGSQRTKELAEMRTVEPNQEQSMESSGPLARRKTPTQAAAEVLSYIVLSQLRDNRSVEDLGDTLQAITDFVTLLQSETSATCSALQETLARSGLAEDMGWLLQETRLHTKLFCVASEAYAHKCAATYPGKTPAMILEDMPLEKRRELRLSAISAASALKDQAVLLLRLSLGSVTKEVETLKRIISNAIVALHPPAKLQRLSAGKAYESLDEYGSPTRQLTAHDTFDQFGTRLSGLKENRPGGRKDASAAGGDCTDLHCSSWLPYQTQSPWFLFQIASCLVDAVVDGIASNIGVFSETELTNSADERSQDRRLPLLTMPRAWRLPLYSHLHLHAARNFLLEILTESEIFQAVDSCVRHIVEMQNTTSEVSPFMNESVEEGSTLQTEATQNLKAILKMAQKQIISVPAGVQKEQARHALIHVILLLKCLCPAALEKCLREYEASRHFRRHELLTQLLHGPSPVFSGFVNVTRDAKISGVNE
ncbi:uncharacterized protein LOC34618800 [Cyclospora cayetanensis]|nr:uncharacterized protein LOC34618800 [Cyclospora cayetanensis]